MKRKLFLFSVVCILFVSVLLKIYPIQKKIYYSDKKNYISVTGVVSKIIPWNNKVILYCEDLQPDLIDHRFVFNRQNADIVIKKQIFNKISEGDPIEFITAPRYFGDAYHFPVVSVTVRQEELLSFDEGYTNIQKELTREIFLGWFA